MDDKNTSLLHGLIIGVAVIVMVYAGEQIKASQTTCYILKSSAMSAALSLVSIVLSLWFGNKSINYEYNAEALKAIEQKDDVSFGANSAMRDFYNEWNWRATILSIIFMLISVISFATGVCLI